MKSYWYNDEYTDLNPNISQQIHGIVNNLFLDNQSDNAKILKSLQNKDIKKLEEITDYIKDNFERVIFIGMGAAALIPMAITALKKHSIIINYINTTEPEYIDHLVKKINFNKTAFVTISKSGQTAETITLFNIFLDIAKQSIARNVNKHFYFITGQQKNKIRLAAETIEATIIDHEDLSGRYCTFASVGLFSIMISGLDTESFRAGGQFIVDDIRLNNENSIINRAATFILSSYIQNIRTSVCMPYINRLQHFAKWQEQLFAESLSRNKSGITAIAAQGPQDQHTQLQLFLDGPKDKFFTLIYNEDTDKKLDKNLNKAKEVLKAGLHTVLEAIIQNQSPIRTIGLSNFNENTLGMLMMHAMLEVIAVGRYLSINPFEQPAIQKIKDLILNKSI